MSSPDVPSAPTNLRTSNVTTESATLEWNSSRTDGGSRIQAYVVEVKEAGLSLWFDAGNTERCSLPVSKLKPDTDYTFRVHALNDIGASEWTTLNVPLRTKKRPVVEEDLAGRLSCHWCRPFLGR